MKKLPQSNHPVEIWRFSCLSHFTRNSYSRCSPKSFRDTFIWTQLSPRFTVWKDSTNNAIFSSNRHFSDLFSKPLLSRNFCQKCVRENSFNFYNVAMWQRFSFSIKSKQTLGKLQMFQFDKLLREINYIVFNTSIWRIYWKQGHRIH